VLKSQLERKLAYYKGMVYTDDSIKSAKDDRATLNKAKKVIEDARKTYKAKCLEPYEALEPQIKELVEMIESQRTLIDDTVKEFEERQKAEKAAEVKAYYDKKAFVLDKYAEPLYAKILDPKWLNASTTKAKYEEEVQLAINHALYELNEIKAMGSPFVDTLIEIYISSLSMKQVKEKNEELISAYDKVRLTQQPAAENVSPVLAVDSHETKVAANQDGGMVLKIYATQYQLNQITDFMKAIGVTYEVQ
jgi:hypothetical protein